MQVIMLYEIYFIKHYCLFFKENNFALMSRNQHPPTTDDEQDIDDNRDDCDDQDVDDDQDDDD